MEEAKGLHRRAAALWADADPEVSGTELDD